MAGDTSAGSLQGTAAAGQSRKILPLTSIRFFAALYVVLFHAFSPLPWVVKVQWLHRLAGFGYIAVSFFFVLSGFVLALAYIVPGRIAGLRSFYVARFARIYPALFVALLLELPHFFHAQVLLAHRPAGKVLSGLVVSFAALTGFFVDLPVLDGPSWSLTAEFFFYACFPFLAVRLWRRSAPQLWTICAVLFVGSMMVLHALDLRGVELEVLEKNPVLCLPEFFLGVSLARLYVYLLASRSRSERLQRWAAPLLLAGVFLCFAAPLCQVPISRAVLQHTAAVPAFGLIILAAASGNSAINSVFGSRWLVQLGEASFALYLLHMPLSYPFRTVIQTHQVAGPFVYLLTCILLSLLSFKYVEVPARRWILAKWHTRSDESRPVQALAQ